MSGGMLGIGFFWFFFPFSCFCFSTFGRLELKKKTSLGTSCIPPSLRHSLVALFARKRQHVIWRFDEGWWRSKNTDTHFFLSLFKVCPSIFPFFLILRQNNRIRQPTTRHSRTGPVPKEEEKKKKKREGGLCSQPAWYYWWFCDKTGRLDVFSLCGSFFSLFFWFFIFFFYLSLFFHFLKIFISFRTKSGSSIFPTLLWWILLLVKKSRAGIRREKKRWSPSVGGNLHTVATPLSITAHDDRER